MKLAEFTIPSEITVRCIKLEYQEGNAMRWLFHLKLIERWKACVGMYSKVTKQATYAEVVLPAHLADTPERAWYNVQGVIKAGHWLNEPRPKP